MIRLHFTAEGSTEQNFVRKILTPHLAALGVYSDARCVMTSRDNRTAREYRGGVISYQKAKADIMTWIKEDNRQECRFTTMFDLYRLPNDFPGYLEANNKTDPYEKVTFLENAIAEDINDSRFIPYIQLHEFEALIFADPQKLDWEYLDHQRSIMNLVSMVEELNPELINERPELSPSNRIINQIPEYDKATAGVSVVEKIGLDVLREKCRHFNAWVTQLEQLV